MRWKLVIVVVSGVQLEDTKVEALAIAGRALAIALLQPATALVQLLQQGQSLFTSEGFEFGHRFGGQFAVVHAALELGGALALEVAGRDF
ncbi:MAG: hypothetical protein VCC02_02965 [Myxococcota bacterium]